MEDEKIQTSFGIADGFCNGGQRIHYGGRFCRR